MSLWGSNDNVTSAGRVWLNYATGVVTATGTNFGQVGAAATGDIIRFGLRGNGIGTGRYHGDAVIISIASTTQLTIGSTAGLSGVAIANTDFYVSQLPKYTVLDSKYSESASGTNDSVVYGISTSSSAFPAGYNGVTHQGWVGVTTYRDMHGNIRVKTETLVAMSGITTGNNGILYPRAE